RRVPRERAAVVGHGAGLGRGGHRAHLARHRRRPRTLGVDRAFRCVGRLQDPFPEVRCHHRGGRRGRAPSAQGELTTSPTAHLSAAGVSIWLDDLSRERITSGSLAELIKTRDVVGVTTNPTIFAGALSNGASYADSVKQLAADGVTT